MTFATPANRTSSSRRRMPSLASGDRLTRAEFERRYAALPHGRKYELIEGIVYMSPPLRHDAHAEPHATLVGWLLYYRAKTPGLLGLGDNGTVRLDNDNEVQPDLYLLLPAHAGGRAIKDADGYITGAPALVCEVAASSVSIDLRDKKDAYLRNGVQEYLVWRTEDGAIDWFFLDDGNYAPLPPQSDGALCSRAFPGLCLCPASLLAGDLQSVLKLLDASTSTADHADFVATLKK